MCGVSYNSEFMFTSICPVSLSSLTVNHKLIKRNTVLLPQQNTVPPGVAQESSLRVGEAAATGSGNCHLV